MCVCVLGLLWDKFKKRKNPQFGDRLLSFLSPFFIFFSAFCRGLHPLCVGPNGLQCVMEASLFSPDPDFASASLGNAWQGASTKQLAFLRVSQIPLPARVSQTSSRLLLSLCRTIYNVQRDRQNIYYSSQPNCREGGVGLEKNSIRLDSKLVPCHDTCSGVARQVPSFPIFYYHPCLNYSVAAISITPAILYLAPPTLTASTFHSKYCPNIPDKREEMVAQSRVQLVTKKNKRGDFLFFFFLFLGLSILKSQD